MTPTRRVIIGSKLLLVVALRFDPACGQVAGSRPVNVVLHKNNHGQLAPASNIARKELAIRRLEKLLQELNASASIWCSNKAVWDESGKMRTVPMFQQLYEVCAKINVQSKELQSSKYKLTDADMVRIQRDMLAMNGMAAFVYCNCGYERPYIDDTLRHDTRISPLGEVQRFLQGKQNWINGVD
jgi:hypothetical protein